MLLCEDHPAHFVVHVLKVPSYSRSSLFSDVQPADYIRGEIFSGFDSLFRTVFTVDVFLTKESCSLEDVMDNSWNGDDSIIVHRGIFSADYNSCCNLQTIPLATF